MLIKSDANDITLVNPVSQDLDLRIKPLTQLSFNTVERSRYYSMIWIKQGRVRVKYELSEHLCSASCILFFAPFQPFVFTDDYNGPHIGDSTLRCNGYSNFMNF